MILKVELTQPDLEMAVRLFLKHEHGLNIPPEGGCPVLDDPARKRNPSDHGHLRGGD